ncbi:exodeoxyribonuclease III [Shimazuella sp. AN120528]|uniref:exodeoxyribonuclease III n=1 Tax=Shimazuella soli TaxID=1892854 RepID=UPI001F0F8A4F|nr:exodeoxyribonuclease III [Shimazuella soli]MCH5584611.1 exodeoxyribonuclease III [Shimazuella soli]
MKFVSWNVNGLRSVMKKGDFRQYLEEADADIVCLQETKIQEGQVDLDLKGYHTYWNYAEKKGYSGTAIFTKQEPLAVTYGLDLEEYDQEGRVITMVFENFYLLTVYTPNSKRGLIRLDYRMKWEEVFLDYIERLDKHKPVIFCGDLNVAHQEIDIKNPKTNRKSAGFSDEEREKFSILLSKGFIDTYRYLYPDQEGAYTWWSNFSNARAKNSGWRLDYFVVSERLKNKIKEAGICNQVMGSDHCPIELEIDI